MNEADPKPESWGEALRRGGDSILGLVQTRLELFSIELQEEKLRAIKLLIWLGVALAIGVAGILVVIGALALWFWNLAGYWGLVGLAALTLGAATGIFLWLRDQICHGPRPFDATLSEFRKDREWLHPKD